MVLFNLLVISLFCAISASDPQIERQNSDNNNYESLNRYKPTDSYSTSGGYYPRNVYEQLNRYNVDLSGREFRPPNVFAAGLISTATPYASPLMAQPRQYQVSMSGPSGLLPYQGNGSPLLQSSSYGMAGMGGIGGQYSGLNSGPYGYGGGRISIGDSLSSMGQGYGYGNSVSDPYYGIGNRQSYAMSPMNPFSGYGGQGLYSSPYLGQSPNYQSLSYMNPSSGYLNRGYGSYGPQYQYSGQSYQSVPFTGGQMGANTGYNNYNNYNTNSGLGSTQNGLNEGREEKSYSASTQTETHSGAQASNEVPVFQSTRIIKRTDRPISARSGHFVDHRMTE